MDIALDMKHGDLGMQTVMYTRLQRWLIIYIFLSVGVPAVLHRLQGTHAST